MAAALIRLVSRDGRAQLAAAVAAADPNERWQRKNYRPDRGLPRAELVSSEGRAKSRALLYVYLSRRSDSALVSR